MIRSLFSGASGMKNHQTRLDVIGNNVANVNTTGFKGSRANFQDILYQWARQPSAAVGTKGGVNPSQVGLGLLISSITNDTGGGGLQNTGRTLDVGVSGNGWFILSTDGNDVTPNSGNVAYTREGIFYVDNAGNLVNSNGYNVCDNNGKVIQFNIKGTGTEKIGVASINIEQNGTISYMLMDGTVYDANRTINIPVDDVVLEDNVPIMEDDGTGTGNEVQVGTQTSITSTTKTFNPVTGVTTTETVTVTTKTYDDGRETNPETKTTDPVIEYGAPTEPLTKIGLAMFANQDGLERAGSNLFKSSSASGIALAGANSIFGEANEGGYGSIQSGFTEMSNVDLTDEFISMITTQRGYQANARTVTTSDSILEELLNIKR